MRYINSLLLYFYFTYDYYRGMWTTVTMRNNESDLIDSRWLDTLQLNQQLKTPDTSVKIHHSLHLPRHTNNNDLLQHCVQAYSSTFVTCLPKKVFVSSNRMHELGFKLIYFTFTWRTLTNVTWTALPLKLQPYGGIEMRVLLLLLLLLTSGEEPSEAKPVQLHVANCYLKMICNDFFGC